MFGQSEVAFEVADLAVEVVDLEGREDVMNDEADDRDKENCDYDEEPVDVAFFLSRSKLGKWWFVFVVHEGPPN